MPDDAVRLIRYGVDEACRATLDLLDQPDQPSGVFAYDDTIAAGVLKAARLRGLTVPGDLAVIGFDDSELAVALDLTTVRQPFEESGRAGIQLLLDRMQNPAGSWRHTELKLSVVVRATT